jgi:hypothetical protein
MSMRSRLLRYLSSKFEKLSLVDIKSIVGGWVEFYQNKKKRKKKDVCHCDMKQN